MPTPTIDLDHLLELRLVVARFGEMDLAKWWNTKGQLGRLGTAALRRGFPRTHRFAQARSVFAVAAHRCAEIFDPPKSVTLWSLPEALEEEFCLNWEREGIEIANFCKAGIDRLASRPQNTNYFGRPGLTWPLRTKSELGVRVMPRGCAFGHKGPAAVVDRDTEVDLLALLAIVTGKAFRVLVEFQLAAAEPTGRGGVARSYEVGVIQRTPVPVEDRSLAIAHGLEDVFWVEGDNGKWTARKGPTRSVDELIREHTSPAVKSALKNLLEASGSGGTGKKTKKGKASA
jgi:hypothetical protein